MSQTVELRCPVGPQRLLSKLRMSGIAPVYTDDNLIEFACSDCKRTLRNSGRTVLYVLHRYNFIGVLVETEVVEP
jgi:hypothetical protein